MREYYLGTLCDATGSRGDRNLPRFLHGDCHMLSQYISAKHALDVGIIKSHPSGIPVHSFVYLNEIYAFDAHGIDLIENTINRYRDFSHEYSENEIRTERLGPQLAQKELSFWCAMDQEEHDFVAAELQHLDSLTGIFQKIDSTIKPSAVLKPKNPIFSK